MKVLLTGATGFLGGRILRRLLADGYSVRAAVRDPAGAGQRFHGEGEVEWVAVDFTRALEAADWAAAVAGVDAAINAVGILREHGSQTFDLLHRRAPCALFEACARAGVSRVLQISALGADADARSAYHLSKRAADACLLAQPLRATVIQPSLVYGQGGASAGLFGMLATLPLTPLPGGGGQRIQPVHVDDLTEAVSRLLTDAAAPSHLALVGPQPIALRDYLATLRTALGAATPPRILTVPPALARLGARLAAVWPAAPLDSETLAMLERGNTADAAPLTRLLGRPPRTPQDFVEATLTRPLGIEARLRWLLPVLRGAVAAVWIFTGIVSMGLYPVADSLDLLARSGVPPALQLPALYGAAALDIVLGVLCFVPRGRRWTWRVQAALILAYMLIISLRLPEFWLHPYGPLTKNLPMLAAIWMLYEMEEGGWTTRS